MKRTDKKGNKLSYIAVSSVLAIINALMFLYTLLFLYGFVFENITIAIAVVASLLVGQIWYFVLGYIFNKCKSHDKFSYDCLFSNNKIESLPISIHLTIFVIGFISALSQFTMGSIWFWIFVQIIDFPLLHWFHVLFLITGSAFISGVIVYAITGTFFWYIAYLAIKSHSSNGMS